VLKTIIEKEIRDIIGSTKFAVSFGACAVLIILSFYVGAKNYQVSQTRYEAAITENLRQFDGLTDWFSVEQHRIFLPPQPLEALVTGVSNDIGRTTEITGRGELTAHDSRFNEDPVYAVFRFLDLDFLFVIVISLFAIMLGYDAVSGEKESGTLRLAMSNAVPRATYILGKLMGSFLALVVPLVATLGIGCLLLPLLKVPLGGEEWMRLLLIILAGLLYFGVFLALAVFTSAMTERSSNSFLVLLVIWIVGVVIVPRASVVLAARTVDVESIDELATKKAAYQRQLWKEHRESLTNFKPSENGGTDSLFVEFQRFMEDLANQRDAKLQEYVGRLNEERHNGEVRQQKLAFTLARISPAAQLSLAVSTLAGTSIDLKDHYLQEANAYQGEYGAFMKEKTGMNPGGRVIRIKEGVEDGEEPAPIDPKELPDFSYTPAGTGETLAAVIPDLGLLTLLNIVFFFGAFVAFLRYDVR